MAVTFSALLRSLSARARRRKRPPEITQSLGVEVTIRRAGRDAADNLVVREVVEQWLIAEPRVREELHRIADEWPEVSR